MLIDRAGIMSRIPHQGASCLLDSCSAWTATTLSARTRAHLREDNPLRFEGWLGPLAGAEMAMQAAALHGALTGAGERLKAPAYLAALRDLEWVCERLDVPEYGTLHLDVVREQSDTAGMIYGFKVTSANGENLVSGRGIVMFRPLGRPS